MDVKRRSKSGRLLRFEEREGSVRVFRAGLDGHSEGAEVDRPPFARPEYQRFGLTSHDDFLHESDRDPTGP